VKKIVIILIVLVLLLPGCNSKEEEKEIKIVVDGEEIPIDDFLDSAEKAIEDSAFGEILATDNDKPIYVDTNELNDDEYRIRSVFEAIYYIWQDPYESDLILTDEATVCDLYNDLIFISGYKGSIETFNKSLLANEIIEQYSLKIDHFLLPKSDHAVNTIIYGMYDTFKYKMFAGEINENQNSIMWLAVEASNGTNAKEVAILYTEMNGLQLESYILDEKIIYYFSGQEGWFLSTVIGVKEFSTVYLWDYEDAICAVIVPGEHEEENFGYCDFMKLEI